MSLILVVYVRSIHFGMELISFSERNRIRFLTLIILVGGGGIVP